MPTEEDPVLATGNMYRENVAKFGRVVLKYANGYTCRQTK